MKLEDEISFSHNQFLYDSKNSNLKSYVYNEESTKNTKMRQIRATKIVLRERKQ